MITCREAVSQLWDYLDGLVEPGERAAVEEHLAVCRRCCGELEFAEELRGLLAEHAQDDLPADVQARFEGLIDELGRRT